jgi:chemotaxis protein CheD
LTRVVVGTGECKISVDPNAALVTYALGSCIALAVHDPATKASGLLHFMLPDSQSVKAKSEQWPYLCADTGIPLMLRKVAEKGGNLRRLLVWAVGGAQVMSAVDGFEIGKRNYVALRNVLRDAGITLNAEMVGGNLSRNVGLEIGPGRLWVRCAGEAEPRTLEPKGVVQACHFVS